MLFFISLEKQNAQSNRFKVNAEKTKQQYKSNGTQQQQQRTWKHNVESDGNKNEQFQRATDSQYDEKPRQPAHSTAKPKPKRSDKTKSKTKTSPFFARSHGLF